MAEIHIVGTAHVSQKSVNEVLETVDLVNPDVIAIELDQGRFATLKKQMKEEEDAKAGIVSEEADGKAPNDNYGKAGDLFPGTSNVTSYTPYAKYVIKNIKEVNGVISFSFVDETSWETPNGGGNDIVEGDCFEETFDALLEEGSVDITNSIDEYTDNEGWDGYKLFCSSGMLKVGSSKAKGYVISPELPFDGDVQIEFVGAAYKNDATISFEIGGEEIHKIDVTSQKRTYIFDVNGLEAYSQITIYSSDNRFYVDNFKVCKKQVVSTDLVNAETEIVLLNSGGGRVELLGVDAGAIVSCYDGVGRLLWCEEADGGGMEFDAPQGLYVLRIVDGEKVSVVKGIGD